MSHTSAAYRVHDLVTGPLLQIYKDARMAGQETAEHLRQVLVQGQGVEQQADMTFVPGAIVSEFTVQAVHLLEHEPGMMHQCTSRSRHLHAPPHPVSPPWRGCARLAESSVLQVLSAPPVIVPASWTFRNSRRSVRSKRMRFKVPHSGSASA